jgi:hypothetical protein
VQWQSANVRGVYEALRDQGNTLGGKGAAAQAH